MKTQLHKKPKAQKGKMKISFTEKSWWWRERRKTGEKKRNMGKEREKNLR